MKMTNWTFRVLGVLAATIVAVPLISGGAAAQQFPGPLTVEGLHQQPNPSAAARAFGGVTIGSENAIGGMFINPASLHSLTGPQVSIAGSRHHQDLRQVQHFAPVRYYPNLSLLLEGLTARVPDPDTTLVGFTPADTVQRPFDDIQPRWSRSNTDNLPLHALVAVPFSLEGITFTAGIGAVQYADLRTYDQNNNVLDPAVLSTRPLPILRPTDDNPLTVDWLQSTRSREGTLRGYGIALAGRMERYDLTVGLSGLLLDGSTDDFEHLVDRGQLTFFANEFRADSSYGRVTRSGTSDFSGAEFTVSSILNSQYVLVGIVLRPPTTITRSFEMDVVTDTTGTPSTNSISGEDDFQLPWRGSAGLLLRPREELQIGLEYELRPYDSATLTRASGTESSPWTSSSVFRIGVQYEPFPWLDVRAGLRRDADVFVPAGSPIDTEPVTFRVYTAGVGINFSGVRWNIAYEHANVTFHDAWGSAVSNNSERVHTFVTDLSFTIPNW